MEHHFDYDQNALLDIAQIGEVERDGTIIQDLSYASPRGGRVPAYLVTPGGKGPFAAVIFGHWARRGSPTRNRTEFLEEAVALARAGAVSLLPDAPFARPGVADDPDYFSAGNAELLAQQIVDLRRGVDLLAARGEVDGGRIAFVGHSYNAHAGGILAGVEKRIKAFVLMSGVLSFAEVMRADDPGVVEWREMVGEKKLAEYLSTYGWLDPARYLGHATPAAVLLQYARDDGFLTEARIRHYFDLLSEPRALKIYPADAGHALNAEARRDRFDWLRAQIGLQPLAPAILDGVGEIQ
ncbi:MAG TPA: hypothetical protein VNO70_15690 [Blastocatellia bacterium]|nr:hypothetical protein [Blastocatellia bacterium]